MKKFFYKLFTYRRRKRNEKLFLIRVGASTMQEILRNRDLRRTIQHKCPILDARLIGLGVNVRNVASDKNK